MGYTVRAQLDIAVPVEVAFDTLADHDSWSQWMPSSFTPVGPSLGTLRAGLTPTVRVSGATFGTPITVTAVDRPRTITWGGGFPGLRGDHTFEFEQVESGTRVRSIETWTGWVAWLVFPVVYAGALRVGRAQLAGIGKGAVARFSSLGGGVAQSIPTASPQALSARR